MDMNKSLHYVGVLSPFDLLKTSLKREALLFDAIAIPNIQSDFLFKTKLTQCPIRSIEYLIDIGIVIDPVEKYLGKETYLKKIGKDLYDKRLEEIESRSRALSDELKQPIDLPSLPIGGSLLQFLSYPWGEALKRVMLNLEKKIGLPIEKFGVSVMLFKNQLDYDRRTLACDLRDKYAINAYPIYSDDLVLMDDFIEGNNDVIKVVLESIPEPDFETTPWEQIIDFKNDAHTKKLLSYFWQWTSQITKKRVTFHELSEELIYYCNKYEEHIKTQKMKVNYGILETLLMIPAEMLEGLVRLKPTQTVKALFSFKRQRLQLLEAELKAPGRDLAYLIKAKQEFAVKEKIHHMTEDIT
jgi:hypothetical protein